jgi:hypothetical protein
MRRPSTQLRAAVTSGLAFALSLLSPLGPLAALSVAIAGWVAFGRSGSGLTDLLNARTVRAQRRVADSLLATTGATNRREVAVVARLAVPVRNAIRTTLGTVGTSRTHWHGVTAKCCTDRDVSTHVRRFPAWAVEVMIFEQALPALDEAFDALRGLGALTKADRAAYVAGGFFYFLDRELRLKKCASINYRGATQLGRTFSALGWEAGLTARGKPVPGLWLWTPGDQDVRIDHSGDFSSTRGVILNPRVMAKRIRASLDQRRAAAGRWIRRPAAFDVVDIQAGAHECAA